MYARIAFVADIATVNELLVGVPLNFAVAGTAAIAFPSGVLASAATIEALRKPRRFMKLNGLLIFFDTPQFVLSLVGQ
jgi:hypothetical protein